MGDSGPTRHRLGEIRALRREGGELREGGEANVAREEVAKLAVDESGPGTDVSRRRAARRREEAAMDGSQDGTDDGG